MTRDDTLIAGLIEDTLQRSNGRSQRVVSIRELDSSLTTSYPVAVLSVGLSDGTSRKVFLKDFGSSRLPKTGRPPARELHVYRDLLDGTFPDAPAYLGSIWSEDGDRKWLLLEYVEARELKEFGFERWVDAVRMLGGLHGRFASRADALDSSPLLARHDAEFFRGRAERARRSLEHFDPAFRRRLDAVLTGHDRLAERLGSLPQTLVHGSCRPRNLLVDERGAQPRSVAIDWELAACGSGLYDLGFLTEGFVSPQLDVILDAYSAGVREHGGEVPDDAELRVLLDGFRFHKEIKSLGDAHEFAFKDRSVDKILRLSEELAENLR